jgi:HK97 gp10 family phage protein
MPASLKSRFPEILVELRPRVSAAVKEAAEVVQEAAQERVPVDDGDLYEAIHVERVGVGEYSVVAGNDDVFYGHIVEHGSTHSPAHPFMVPAAEASRFPAEALVTAALRGL